MRGVKPEIWTDEKFVSVSPLARLLFIGMWNHACDNGHVDSSPVQLKMRVLPMDNCDVPALIDELLEVGLIERQGGCLKVTNLAVHQRIDFRWLTLCDHCAHDENAVFTEEDRKGRKGQSDANPTGPQRAPDGATTGPRLAPDDERRGDEMRGDEGDGERTRKRAIPLDYQPSPKAITWQQEHHPAVNVADETERFINHHRSKGSKFVDLDAAWRNWIKNAVRFAAEQPRHLTPVPRSAWTPPPGSPLSYVEM